GVRKATRERIRGAGTRVLRHASVEVLHHIPHVRERSVVEKEPGVPELPQRQRAELEGIVVASSDVPPSVVNKVWIVSHQAIQGLYRMVAQPEIEKVFFHELTGSGHVGVVHLLVEHRAAVAGEATCATSRRGREEELGSAPLADRQ